MNRILLISLAASALIPVTAAAQQNTVAPPVRWEDVPPARLRVPAPPPRVAHPAPAPAPGVSWQPPRVAAPQQARVAPRPQALPRPAPQAHRAPAPQPLPIKPVTVRHGHQAAPIAPHGAVHGYARGDRTVSHRRDERAISGHHRINKYRDYQRVERGYGLPQYWWGPRFHVGSWGQYGLPRPMHGSRWVRYYDDALLIDSYGRVQDGRWGMNWDEYGHEWGHDDRGIPIYVGDGDFHPDGEDYAWVEGAESYADGYGHGGYGYESYESYGREAGHQQAYAHYGYPYGAVVTETTVTTSPTVVTETYYVDEVVEVAPRRAKHRSKTIRCNC